MEDKNYLIHRLEKASENEVQLRGQLQQLQENNEKDVERLQYLEKEKQFLHIESEQNEQIHQMQVVIQDLQEELQVSNTTLEETRRHHEEVLSKYSDNEVRKTQYEETLVRLHATERKCKRLQDELKLNENNLKTHKDENERLKMQIDDLQSNQQQRRCRICCIIC